jgi:hypothetical protein
MKIYFLKAIEKGNTLAMFKLGEYFRSIEKNYELAKKYYLLLLLNFEVNTFYECFVHKIIKNIILMRLIINDICELFSVKNNKYSIIDKVKLFTQCIIEYLKKEDDYELLPESMNIYFLYIGKILNKCKKGEKRKIINSEINDIKKIREIIIENFINKTITNKNISTLIIKKYFKELYEVNK